MKSEPTEQVELAGSAMSSAQNKAAASDLDCPHNQQAFVAGEDDKSIAEVIGTKIQPMRANGRPAVDAPDGASAAAAVASIFEDFVAGVDREVRAICDRQKVIAIERLSAIGAAMKAPDTVEWQHRW